MSELRRDPIVDRWVIIASERGKRPTDFEAVQPALSAKACPFCPGEERTTPPEVFAIREDGTAPNTPGWQVRVVPNKFPALSVEGELNRRGLGMFDLMNGVGAHEIIIESPDHNLNLADAPVEQLDKILIAYRERILDLRKDKRFLYTLVFRNYGFLAGATLDHPHSQLIAIAILPRTIKQKLNAAREHYHQRERCLFCDLLNQEIRLSERIVFESEHFVVLSPFASRFPYELQIYPRRHCHDFVLMDEKERFEFAKTLKLVLGAIKTTLNNPPYNYVLDTAPNPIPKPGHPEYWGTLQYDYHWHLELIPRLTRVAGFEWGTGFYINPVSPEEATRVLREVLSLS